MPDVFPVDFTSPVGRVRKYVPDLQELPDPLNPAAPPSYIFSDADIQSFISDEAGEGTVQNWHIRRAAAWAMIALANTENLILKKITTQDQQTDGPAVARQLIAAASLLFEQAKAEEAASTTASETEGLIAVFQPVTHDYAYDRITHRYPYDYRYLL
jgi:hypothetical protein